MEQRDWHTVLPGAAGFTGSTTGHLMGNGYPDVVVLQGGKAHILASPGAMNTLSEIVGGPTGCTALATRFQQWSANGRRLDQVLVSHAGGVSAWSPWGGWSLVLTGAAWQSARQIIVANVNADAFEDVIAVGPPGTGIHVLLGTSSGYGQEFWLNVNPLSVTTVTWNADAVREIAVVTTTGLTIYDYDFTDPVAIAGTSCTGAILTAVRRPGGELLTMAARNGSSTWSLHMVDPVNPGSATMGSLDLVACAAGDVDADGDDDLIFSQRSNHRATLLVQRPGYWFAYTTTDAMELPLIGSWLDGGSSANPAPANDATPALVDVDGDGDADMVHPVESTKRLAIVRPPFGAARSITPQSTGDQNPLSCLMGESLGFEVRTKIVKEAWFPAQATHIEVVAWWLRGSVLHGWSTLQADPGNTALLTLRQVVATSASVITIAAQEELFNAGYAALVQYRPIQVVTVGGQDRIVRTFTPTTCYFASNDLAPIGTPPDNQTLNFARSVANAYGSNQGEATILRLDGVGGPQMQGGGGDEVDASTDGKADKDADKGSGGVPGPSSAGGINGGGEIIINPPPPVGGSGSTGPG